MKAVDCSQTIWILATNALDDAIMSFCKQNPAVLDEVHSNERGNLLDDLTTAMRRKFISVFKVSEHQGHSGPFHFTFYHIIDEKTERKKKSILTRRIKSLP